MLRFTVTRENDVSPSAIPRSLFAAALLVLCACPATPPVAEIATDAEAVRLPYPGFADLTITLTPALRLESDGEAGTPVVFLHLLSDEGEVLRTFDRPLAGSWTPGEALTHTVRLYQSALGPPIEPGSYRLAAGLYRPGAERWPLAGAEELGEHEYAIATAEVPEPGRVPELEFSSAWAAAESGTDRQVLARRWLGGAGTVTVSGLESAGTLWLVVAVPRLDDPATRLVVDGDESAALSVAASCSASRVSLSGPGTHHVELPVVAAPPDGDCEITLTPNFHLVLERSFERRSLSLETLAWRPEEG